MSVCSCSGYHTERAHIADLVNIYGPVDPLPHLRVRDDNIRYMQACNIESLARGNAGDGTALEFFGNRCERDILVTRIYKLAMYLVSYDRHTVPEADLPYPCQFLTGPDTPGWVVRVAQDHELHGRVRCLLFKVIEINSESIAVTDKRIGAWAKRFVNPI